MSGSLVEKIDTLEKVGELWLRSYKPGEIARALDIPLGQAKAYINDYKQLVGNRAGNDPDFLDRIGENTIEALDRLDSLIKETWETYEKAKVNEMIAQQINLLKAAGTFEQQRANLLQLMGAKMDGGMMARTQRAERVNEMLAMILKETVSQCPTCKAQVMPRLAEAFAAMNRMDEAAEMHPVDDIEDAEIVEEDTHDQEAMMADVIALD